MYSEGKTSVAQEEEEEDDEDFKEWNGQRCREGRGQVKGGKS